MEKAISLLEKRVEEQKDTVSMSFLIQSYELRGHIWSKQKNYAKAQIYYEKALEITKEIQKEENTGRIRRDIAVCYANLGGICEEESRLEDARHYYADVFEIHKTLYDEEPTQSRYAACAIACKKMMNTYRIEENIGGMLKWFGVFESLGKVE